MFKLLFITRIKILLRNKAMLFWTLIFPFVLGTFFQLALSNIGEAFEMDVIPIAVVDNQYYQENENLKNVITSLSEENKNQIFNTTYVTESKAEELLKNEEIDGYILLENNDEPQIIVKENGLNQTVIKSIIDEYYQMSNVANQAIQYNPEVIYNGVLELLGKNKDFVIDASDEKIDFSINYFFTLIAMTCLYASLISLEIVKDTEANLSKKGARVCMAPVSKMKITLAGLLAGYIIQLITLGLLFLFLIFVFKVNFGNYILPTIILASVGALAGICLGAFVGVSNRKSEGFKTGLLIALIMSCCFFSGMMGTQQIKVFFDETFPVFAKINPINIITDGLYALFAYDTLDIYYNCLMRISIFSIILIALIFVFIRRKKYDSI